MGITGDLLKLIKSFLSNRVQRVLLNGQHSEWLPIKAGVPQGSILGPLFFLAYINDLSDGLESTVKLFADDTSIFAVISDPVLTSTRLNNDLKKVSEWANQWKMSFNPGPAKQAQEVIFSRKQSKTAHQKLQKKLPQHSLVTIYKSFIRPHLDYGDVIYDQPNNENFCQNIEAVQYNAALAITGAIRGTSKEKLYRELGIESLKSRRWFRRLCFFFKIQSTGLPQYLFDLIPQNNNIYNTRNTRKFGAFHCRTDFFKNSFFPYTLGEWNKLDTKTCNSNSFLAFRKIILKLIRPSPNPIFGIHHPVGLKYLVCLRLGLSHLNEHNFRHNFLDTLNPLCSCSLDVETTAHFFLRCHNYAAIRTTLLNDLKLIDDSIPDLSDNLLVNLLLFGDQKFNPTENFHILNTSIDYILKSERFDGPLF